MNPIIDMLKSPDIETPASFNQAVLILTGAHACIQAEVRELERAHSEKQSQLALFQEERTRLEQDIDEPVRLKQGQVEVEPQGIVDSRLDHAVLAARHLVQVSPLLTHFNPSVIISHHHCRVVTISNHGKRSYSLSISGHHHQIPDALRR